MTTSHQKSGGNFGHLTATLVGLLVAGSGNCGFAAAAKTGSTPPSNAPSKSETPTPPAATPKATKGECHGVNSCKGQGECGGPKWDCAGNNSCKGQGWITLTASDCAKKGGTFKADPT